jgi:hypothetical protein
MADLITDGYAPKTIDHIHDVLSAVLRSAVKWVTSSTILRTPWSCRK